MVLVKRTPSFANYKGPLSSKAFEGGEAEDPPLLHMVENPCAYEIEIDVPGLNNKNFLINVEKGTLVISSEIVEEGGPGFSRRSGGRGKIKLVIAREYAEADKDREDCSEPEKPGQRFTVL